MDVNQFFVSNPLIVAGTIITSELLLFRSFGAWSRLAKFYRCNQQFTGDWKGFQTGQVGIISYSRCLWIATSSEGIFLKTGPLFFFRLFHPPLLIPWTAIKSVTAANFLWVENLKLEISQPKTTIVLPLGSLEDHKRFWRDKCPPGF